MANTTQIDHSLDQLSFRSAFLSLGVIVALIAVSILVALFFNNQRKSEIISRYETETQIMITENQSAVQKFFSETFEICRQALLSQQASESSTYKSRDMLCLPAQEALGEMNGDVLKDSSAVAYVKYIDGNYELIEASGKYNERASVLNPNSYSHFNYNQDKRFELNEYLAGNHEIDRWQDFISYIQGKEVLVPVVIEGETLGYIFRGVIER